MTAHQKKENRKENKLENLNAIMNYKWYQLISSLTLFIVEFDWLFGNEKDYLEFRSYIKVCVSCLNGQIIQY